MEKIDLVILYVDSEDKNWQKLYKQYAPQSADVQITGKQRFRGNPHFVYLFRGIEKYAPWINNVFLIVQCSSQVPKWINQNRVKIILHEDIIPSEYLPVFNSQAIEMFLHKIPGLSEKFLYANDDTYIVGDMHPEDFFTEDNKVKTSFNRCKYGSDEDMPLWKKALINSAMLTNKIEAEELKHEGKCLSPMHSIRPYFKSKIEEVHEQYSTEIFNSISKFRESKNFTVYLYDFYLKSLGATVKKNYTSVCFSSISSVGLICTAIINPNIYKTICINDTTEEEDRKRIATITKHFESQFPNLSKYEALN